MWFSLDHSIEVNTGNNHVMNILPLGSVAEAGSFLCQILDESFFLKNMRKCLLKENFLSGSDMTNFISLRNELKKVRSE